jgi:enterochelin esterase family protein
MALAIHELQADGWPDAEAVDAFLAAHAFPLVEETSVTFVWRGEADAVHLRHAVYGLPSSQAFARIPSTDLWYLILELPPKSRMEYKLLVEKDGEERLVRDPRNGHQSHDPYGVNSVCHGKGYETPDWTFPDPEARAGSLREMSVRSRAFGGDRPVSVYLPARLRPARKYPLLVVNDGADYLRYAGMKTVLDNLVHRLEVPSIVVAFTQSPDRLGEYAANVAHAEFVAKELVPALERELPLRGQPSSRGIMGASMGAVASLFAAWRHPGTFGRLLLQSGSFAFTDIGRSVRGPVFEPVVRFVNAFRADPGRPAEKLFVSCGVYESLIYENRSLVPLLQATGMEVKYVEARDGHNWENWRDRLREGLSWLFPGPLWMIYE